MISMTPKEIEARWGEFKHARKAVTDAQDGRMSYADRWARNLDLYEGRHWDTFAASGLREIAANFTRMFVDTKVAALTFQPPKYDVKPTPQTGQPMDPLVAIKLSEFMNRDIVNSGGWDSAQASLSDKYLYGTGIALCGWQYGMEVPVEESHEDLLAQIEYERALAEGQASFNQMGMLVEPPAVTQQWKLVGDGSSCIQVSPFDFFIDPFAKWHNWRRKARYMGRIFIKGLEELREAKVFNVADDIRGMKTLRDGGGDFLIDPSLQDIPDNADNPAVPLVEIWYRRLRVRSFRGADGRNMPAGEYPVKIVWALEKPDKPLQVEVWPYQYTDDRGLPDYPFDICFNAVASNRFFGMGDPELIEEQQRELNHARSADLTRAHNAAFFGYWMNQKAAIPGPNGTVAKLEKQETGKVVFGNGDKPPDVIAPPAADVANSMSAVNAKQDMNVLSAVDEMAQGTTDTPNKTATEAQLISQKSSARGKREEQEWEEFLAGVGRKLLQANIQYKKTDIFVQVSLPRHVQSQMGLQGAAAVQGVQSLPIEPYELVPSQVDVVTGSTRLGNRNEDIQGIQMLLATAHPLGYVSSIQNPNPEGINPRPLLEKLVSIVEAGDMQEIFDVSDILQQSAGWQQFQQFQAMIQQVEQAGQPQGQPQGAPPMGGLGQQ